MQAIASGVNLINHPLIVNDLCKLGALSPDGLSYTFDERANGYSRGEGVGTVILKRFSDAIKDGDTIRGIIRATGCNHDGKTPGIFVPSMQAQQRLIASTYKKAGLDPKDTAYMEAHGTGTAVGDPIEVEAIATAFKDRPQGQPLYIGAVKSALGHTEGAAGILSLIKTLMVVETGIIPPNLNFKKVNPKIRLQDWNVAFPLEAMPWPYRGPRVASANSFGFGGANAHIIISDAYSYLQERNISGSHRCAIAIPSPTEIRQLSSKTGNRDDNITTMSNGNNYTNGMNGTTSQLETTLIFPFSSFDQNGIKRMAQSYFNNLNLQSILSSGPSTQQKFLNNLAYTLACRRSLFSWRATCRASSITDLLDQIQRMTAVRSRNSESVVAFVFTGQGAQWLGMGKSLIDFPVFRKSLEEATEYTSNVLGSSWRLIDAILGEVSYDTNLPSLAQPLCTALQVAAVDLLVSWNILPNSVIGHSSGEIAAAYAAGLIGRSAAWKIAYHRGVVSEKVEKQGSMMAVGLEEVKLRSYMDEITQENTTLTIACFNSPTNLTVSGDTEAIDSLGALLAGKEIFNRKLNVTNAYHSSHMSTVAEEYHRSLGNLPLEDKLEAKHPVTMISTVTGENADKKMIETASYWVQNLVSPVLFSSALLKFNFGETSPSINEVIEIGPHSALKSAIRDTLRNADISGIEYSNIIDRGNDSSVAALNAATALWQRGHPVNIDMINQSHSGTPGALLTSLPAYSFNHETEYWMESRLSRDYRFRQHPRKDLIGAPISDWNPYEPKWRQILRLSEIPWLVDHKVTDNVVYPGVGYIIMALEAVKQSADNNMRVTGFRFRDVVVQTALIIPDTAEGLEVVLSMNASTDSSHSKSKVWNEFHVYSYDENQRQWRIHCRGEVSVEYEKQSLVHSHANGTGISQQEAGLKQGYALCQRPFDTKRHYEQSAKNGIQYGPTFRTVTDVKLGPQGQKRGIASGKVYIADLAAVMPNQFLYPHTVQPATLDCMLQMVYPAVLDLKGAEIVDEPLVPTLFKEVWVSADIDNTPGHGFLCHSQVERIAGSDYRTNVTVWDEQHSSVVVQFTDAEVNHIDVSTAEDVEKLCHNIQWKPDADFLTSGFFDAQQKPELNSEVSKIFHTLQVATAIMIQNALRTLESDGDTFESLPQHHQRYLEWLRSNDEAIKKGEVMLFDDALFQQCKNDSVKQNKLFEQVVASGPNGQLLVKVGSQIVPILRGEVDPLHLMFGEDDGKLMNAVYHEEFELGHIPIHFKSYLDLLSHRGRGLKVLEVGAGTGGTTLPILQTMCPPEEIDAWSILEYTYTDISPAFFEKAAEKFKSWEGIMKFRTFNAETDPRKQDFGVEDKYDVIVAANVIHATSNIPDTLLRLHELLRPGGKLILQEIVQPAAMFASLSVGLLPGWWLATESFRQAGPLLTEDGWNSVLRSSDFSGTDVVIKDSYSESHISSIIVSTAVDTTTMAVVVGAKSPQSPVYIVDTYPKGHSSSPATPLAKLLSAEYNLQNSQIVAFEDLGKLALNDASFIILVDGRSSFLLNLDADDFSRLIHMLNNSVEILWVTMGMDDPTFAMAKGVLRTTRWEKHTSDTNIVTLDIDTSLDKTLEGSVYLEVMAKVYSQQFQQSSSFKSAEYELRGDTLYSSRLYKHDAASEFLTIAQGGEGQVGLQPWGQTPSRPLKLVSLLPGDMNSLVFKDDDYAEPLGDFEVDVEIKAAGLNFRDIMIAMGEISYDCFGFEGSGIVRSVGARVDELKVGDRVAVVPSSSKVGCLRKMFRSVHTTVVKIPDTMSFATAASLPCNFTTVLYSLRDLGRLSKSDSILIHAGAGGTGQVAIQYANLVGAEVFATVSTVEKKKLLMEKYGVKEANIFSSRNTDFAAGVLRATDGRGVDVVLNSLSGEGLRRSWDCIAPLGRFIELGKKDIAENGRLSMRPFDRIATFSSVDLSILGKSEGARVGQLLGDALKLVDEGLMHSAAPLATYSFANITDAFRQLQTGKAMGKIILVPQDDANVSVSEG